MQVPLSISFRNMNHSNWIEEAIRERAEKFDRLYGRVTSCRVVVEMPHKHQHQGNHFNVRIDITVPGKEIVVNREASEDTSAEDFHAVLRDAFDAAKRQLDDFARRRRGEVKVPAKEREQMVALAEMVETED